jgi:hypothetical protein
MNHSYEMDTQNLLVKVKIAGHYSFSEFKKLYHDLLNNSQFKPGSKILFDASEVDFSKMRTSDIKELVKLDKELKEKRGKGKTTFIVSTDIGFGMLRMFEQNRIENHENPVMVFRKFQEAEKWIKE